eukprot:5505671-Prymnesium_polylepis.2
MPILGWPRRGFDGSPLARAMMISMQKRLPSSAGEPASQTRLTPLSSRLRGSHRPHTGVDGAAAANALQPPA